MVLFKQQEQWKNKQQKQHILVEKGIQYLDPKGGVQEQIPAYHFTIVIALYRDYKWTNYQNHLITIYDPNTKIWKPLYKQNYKFMD